MCTATQLGIHRARGMPSLVDACLPERGGPGVAPRRWLSRWLLLPPPPAVAGAVRVACEEFASERLGGVG